MKRHPAAFPGCGPAPLLAARCRVTETPASWPCLHGPTHLAQVSYLGLGRPRLARVVEATFQSCHQKSWQGLPFRVKLGLPASLFPWCPRLASPSAGLGLQPSHSLCCFIPSRRRGTFGSGQCGAQRSHPPTPTPQPHQAPLGL